MKLRWAPTSINDDIELPTVKNHLLGPGNTFKLQQLWLSGTDGKEDWRDIEIAEIDDKR